jgi:hypothetical protein
MRWLSDADKTSRYRAFVLKDRDRDALVKALARELAATTARASGRTRRAQGPPTLTGAPEPELLTSAELLVTERLEEALDHALLPAFECANCGRIFISDNQRSQSFSRFEPEHSTHRPLFQ